MMILELENISKTFRNLKVIHDFSLHLKKGAIGCLLGPSGCGKTTVLRTIAGFELPDTGRVKMNGKTVSSVSVHCLPEKRKIGMVFQDYALFPHLTVFDNISFGIKKMKSSDKKKRVSELLHLVGLDNVAKQFPHELSGGQQQRVALARALAPSPDLLLLDEPFSNLDVTLRERLSAEVRDIIKESKTSALIVTHNQQEAFAMADVIGVMHQGRLKQWDTSYTLYHRPASPEVADFIGEGVMLPGQVTGESEVKTGLGRLNGNLVIPDGGFGGAEVLIRPEEIVYDKSSPLKACVMKKQFRGATTLYKLRLPSQDHVLALLPSHPNHDIGQQIGINTQVQDIILFQKNNFMET